MQEASSTVSFLRESTLAVEGPLKAAKWLKVQVLLDIQEMDRLLHDLGDFFIYIGSGISEKGKGMVSKQAFLENYAYYVNELKVGRIPDEAAYRLHFSDPWTTTTSILYAIPLEKNQQLVKTIKPVVQLQAHSLDYSPLDGKFRPLALGVDSVLWGIQFSYPQIFQDPKTCEIESVSVSEEFPNTDLFHRLQKWVRYHTVATPFVVDEQRINVPMRLGKECFRWINQHPQLSAKNLKVAILEV